MSASRDIQYCSIDSGDVLSTAFAYGRGRDQALVVPTVSSCFLILHGATDNTSATSRRMSHALPPNSGEMRLYCVVGSNCFPIPQEAMALEFGRLESSAAQEAPRTFTISSRL